MNQSIKTNNNEFKQVIVVRVDIRMGKGKLATQVAHASVGAYRKTKRKHADIVRKWEMEGEKKIVLRISSLDGLMKLKSLIDEEGIPNIIIRDAGLTQLMPGTVTCLGIGPWDSDTLDKFISHLKLV